MASIDENRKIFLMVINCIYVDIVAVIKLFFHNINSIRNFIYVSNVVIFVKNIQNISPVITMIILQNFI